MTAFLLHPLTLQIVAASAYAVGGACMKASCGLTRLWPSLALFALFSFATVLQALSMRLTTMAATYVAIAGLEAVGALAISLGWFRESYRAADVAAIALIVVGVGLLRR